MRDCQVVQANIDDWLDDQIDAIALARFESHIAACDSCRRLVNRERRLTEELANLGTVADRIADAARIEAVPTRRSAKLPRIAAAIAFILTGGYLASRIADSPRMTATEQTNAPVAVPDETPQEPYFALADNDTRLAVRMESSDANVHVFWLYETVQPQDGDIENEKHDTTLPGNSAPVVTLQ